MLVSIILLMKNKKQLQPEGIAKFLPIIIIAVIMLIIPLIFFILLDMRTNSGFGLSEILFSIVFSIIVTSFLVWMKSFMIARPYLGGLLGIAAILLTNYSLFLRFTGPYTLTFTIITDLIVVVYLGIYFFKYRQTSSQIKEDVEDTSISSSSDDL